MGHANKSPGSRSAATVACTSAGAPGVTAPRRWWTGVLAAALVAGGCGTWVGNPKGDDDDEETGRPPEVVGTLPSASGLVTAGPGDVTLQRLALRAGEALSAHFAVRGAGLTDAESGRGPLELSVVDSSGRETAYVRQEGEDAAIAFTPPADGDYTVVLKNNTGGALALAQPDLEGAAATEPAVLARTRTGKPFKDVLLKAVVVFARTCKQYTSGGNTTLELKAPAGRAYVQPFVFLGKVSEDGKASAVADATIVVQAGDTSIALQPLASLPLAAYKMASGALSTDEHAAWTRNYYQGYFGGAGELYTVATFRFGGDCSAAATVPVGTDVGQADVRLSIKAPALGLDTSMPVRVTVQPPFSTYVGADQKVTDWTQCTFDRTTGMPTTYNGDAGACKAFSMADQPYVTLDYKLPSGYSDAVVTAVSDPTRLVFYGHAHPRAFYRALIDQGDALRAGQTDRVALPGCLTVGGMTAVPLGAARTYLPLAEFNATPGDILNLARRSGSYTALTDFYQGNIDASGDVRMGVCIPKGSDTCPDWKTLTFAQAQCRLKADSGVSALSLSDNFVYPEYFEMSGTVVP